MPKKHNAPKTTTMHATFPLYSSTTFTSHLDGDRANDPRTHKIRIKYSSLEEMQSCADRAVVIRCGTKASKGQFPISPNEIEVDYLGNFENSIEFEVQKIQEKGKAFEAEAIKILEKKLALLKEKKGTK